MRRSSPVVLGSVVVGLIALTSSVRAQNAEAESLLKQGDALLKEGETAEACEAYEASKHLDPQVAAFARLGECREKNGQIVSAWSAYKEALTRAKDSKKRAIAAKVKELEDRMSYLTINVGVNKDASGLTITRNGETLDGALWNRAAPVNGGEYTIVARAEGRLEWRATTIVPAERGNIAITVPKLPDAPPAPVVTEPVPAKPETTEVKPVAPDTRMTEKAAAPSTFTTKRKIALGLGAVAVAATGAGVALGLQAKHKEDDAFGLCSDAMMTCTEYARANDLLDAGRTRALAANISFGVAGAAAGGALLLWLTGAPKSDTSVAIGVSPSSLSVAGRF